MNMNFLHNDKINMYKYFFLINKKRKYDDYFFET